MQKIASILNRQLQKSSIQRYTTYLNKNDLLCKSKFVYAEEVYEAKLNGTPIVALESTIITHGMPYPDNLEVAIEVEKIIREKGGIPATISIIEGKIHVGTNQENLEKLANNNRVNTMKCSRRDFSYVLNKNFNGGTTVSGTMLVAHLAGIPIMATGGIGGVHRGVETTFDISADLNEFARTPVAVVCAGVKAILDIPKTLEYLETQGVPVIAVSKSDNFPAFYSVETFDKIKAPLRISDTREVADLISVQRDLGINTGIVLAVPIPAEFALDSQEIESVIQKALQQAKHKSIFGRDVTPFLLECVAKFTEGRSLRANKALIKNNANIAVEIALQLSQSPKLRFERDVTNTIHSIKNPINVD